MNDSFATERLRLEEQIVSGFGTVADYFELGRLYLENAQFADLLALYNNLENMDLSQVQLARVYYEKGEALVSSSRDEAIASYRKSLKHLANAEGSEEVLFLKGLCHYNLALLITDPDERRSASEEAINSLRLLLDRDLASEHRYALFSYLAEASALLKKYSEALSDYNRALEIASNPKDRIGALTGIATILGKQKNLKQSEEYFDIALREASGVFPTSKIHYEKGKVYFSVNEFRKAYEAFDYALQNRPDDPALRIDKDYSIELLWHMGTIAYELVHDETALGHLTKVLTEIDEYHYYYASSNLTLGHIYSSRGDYEKARELYNNVLTSPSSFEQEKTIAKHCISALSLDS